MAAPRYVAVGASPRRAVRDFPVAVLGTAVGAALAFPAIMTEVKRYASDVFASTVTTVPAMTKSAARCACGHSRNHPNVLPEPAYTGWSWLLFMIGVTAKPLAVLYRCLWCKQVLGRTREPSVLARFD